MKGSTMPKPKKKSEVKKWVQRCPESIVAAAMKRAATHPQAQILKLDQRNSMVNWMLNQYGAGKLKEVES